MESTMGDLPQFMKRRLRSLRVRRIRASQRAERNRLLQEHSQKILLARAKEEGFPVPAPDSGKWLRTAGEIAGYLGICERTLYYWLSQDDRPPVRKIRGSLNSHSLWLDHWRAGRLPLSAGKQEAANGR